MGRNNTLRVPQEDKERTEKKAAEKREKEEREIREKEELEREIREKEELEREIADKEKTRQERKERLSRLSESRRRRREKDRARKSAERKKSAEADRKKAKDKKKSKSKRGDPLDPEALLLQKLAEEAKMERRSREEDLRKLRKDAHRAGISLHGQGAPGLLLARTSFHGEDLVEADIPPQTRKSRKGG